jgi:1-acyl-sn-glycerol-3-phosphate acyltransferase
MILACNHPNSFLDAIIIGSRFNQPVHFLARGDAFRKPLISMMLTSLKLIPIYRLSEGREYLALNDATFEKCQQVLLNKGIVLVFSEGLCVNGWELRPLKKGTSRIVYNALQHPAIAGDLKILAVGINYNSFRHFGKNVIIHIEAPIVSNDLLPFAIDGKNAGAFNLLLGEKLSQGILQPLHVPAAAGFLIGNHEKFGIPDESLMPFLKKKLYDAQRLSCLKKIAAPGWCADSKINSVIYFFYALLLFPFAIASIIIHYPLYLPLKKLVSSKTRETVFFDSVLFGSLLITYPIYWIIVNVLSFFLIKSGLLNAVIICMPALAWIHVRWKIFFQSACNYLSLSPGERQEVERMLH